jgi:hypothetical protein
MPKMRRINLDWKKLFAFEQVEEERRLMDAPASKVGTKIGVKIGDKPGVKADRPWISQRIGEKIGGKVGDKQA